MILGERVLTSGQGVIGLLLTQLAKRVGCVPVIAVDPADSRLQAVDEAVAFWNRELAGSNVELRLAPVARAPFRDDGA